MRKSIFTFIILFATAMSMCAKGNNKRIIFTTNPQMHCESCEEKITKNLRFVKGVKIIQTDVARQLVTITFDSTKCTSDDLVKAFKRIKYEVKEVDPKSLGDCCSGATATDAKEHGACEDKACEDKKKSKESHI